MVHTYQVAGNFPPKMELIPKELKVVNIKRLGIQMDEGQQVAINGIVFEIGKSERIQFENAEVQSIQIVNNAVAYQNNDSFIIIDFTYDDEEED